MESLRPVFLLRRGSQSLAANTSNTPTRRAFTTTPSLSKTSTQRTKRALKIAPHVSFLSSGQPETDQIVFNPPSSAPSVFNTPFLFLPKTDPRRRARLASHFFADSTSPIPPPGAVARATRMPGGQQQDGNGNVVITGRSSSSKNKPQPTSTSSADGTSMPPAVLKGPFASADRNVTPEQVRHIQKLRQEDPAKWTVQKLAKKFNCTANFIMNCGAAPDAHQQRLRKKLEELRAKWGPIKRKAREEREKRKRMVLRGEI